MKKEDFVALGLSEELAAKIAEKSEEELKGFVPRSRLNEEAAARKNAEASYNDVKAELDKLKESAGDNEAMQKQIRELQDELKTKESDYAKEIADLRINNAIASAIGTSAHDTDIVSGLIDKSKLILSEDGKLTGLDEQVKDIKKDKPYLFKDGETYPDVHDGGEPGRKSGLSTREQFAEALNAM